MITDIVIQPALVGALVALKEILYDGYLPESPHLWMDVGMHVAAKLISIGVTVEFLVPMVGQAARLADPLMHGAMTGLIKEQFIDSNSISMLGLVSVGRMPSPQHYTFQAGFIEGLCYGGVAGAIGAGISGMEKKAVSN